MVGKVDARLNGAIVKLSEYYETHFEQGMRSSLSQAQTDSTPKEGLLLKPCPFSLAKDKENTKAVYKNMERICATARIMEGSRSGSRKAVILGSGPVKPYRIKSSK